MEKKPSLFDIDPAFEKNVTESLEASRQEVLAGRRKNTAFLVGGIVVFMMSGMIPSAFSMLIALFAMGMVAKSALGLSGSKAEMRYEEVYKSMLVNNVMKSVLDDYQYIPVGRFDADYLDALALYNRAVRTCSYYGEDLLAGEYKGVAFRQADARISYTVGSGKNKRTVWVMRGRIAEFAYGKEIHHNISIIPKSYTEANIRGMKKVETENVEFNKKYRVYCNDPHTLFYVLTPHLMEYIERLNADTQTYIKFVGNKVMVCQPQAGGSYEPNYKRQVDVRTEYSHIYKDLRDLLDIIDILELDDAMEQRRNLEQEADW